MQYKYRWVYAILFFAITAMSGFLFCIQPLRVEIEMLIRNKASLLDQIKQIKLENVKPNVQANKEIPMHTHAIDHNRIFLNEVLALLQANQLILDSITFLPEETAKESLQLVLEGDFLQFRKFIIDLVKQNPEIIFKNFAVQMNNKNRLSMNLELSFLELKNFLFNSNAILNITRDPFCNVQNNITNDVSAKLFSIKQMRLIGIAQKNNKPQAFILFPNESIAIVEIFDRLGLEDGIVVAIKPNKVIVELPSKSKMELNL